MNTFTTGTHNVLARYHVHPDRHPPFGPGAVGPARRRELSPDRPGGPDADLLCPQELESAIHDDLRVRLRATRLALRKDSA